MMDGLDENLTHVRLSVVCHLHRIHLTMMVSRSTPVHSSAVAPPGRRLEAAEGDECLPQMIVDLWSTSECLQWTVGSV